MVRETHVNIRRATDDAEEQVLRAEPHRKTEDKPDLQGGTQAGKKMELHGETEEELWTTGGAFRESAIPETEEKRS